jgi:DNA invertase Pin-like site-specific DNA recombinase
MRAALYVRVSTPGQDTSRQIETLQKYCQVRGFEVVQMFEDVATGATTERPGFQALMHLIARGGVDAIIVQKLDRMGRSLRDLLNIVDTLRARNVGFVAVHDSIDTTSNSGRLFFYIAAAFAEYERELIRERCEAGKSRARAEGVRFGRPPIPIDMDAVRTQLAAGTPKRRIARDLKISHTTLYQALKNR